MKKLKKILIALFLFSLTVQSTYCIDTEIKKERETARYHSLNIRHCTSSLVKPMPLAQGLLSQTGIRQESTSGEDT